MTMKLFLLCAGVCMNAAAQSDAPPQPHPLALDNGSSIAASKAAGVAFAKNLASPTMNETSAVRQSDGTLALICKQVPNPKRPPPPNQNVKQPDAGAPR